MTFNFMLNEKLKSFGWKPGYFRHVNTETVSLFLGKWHLEPSEHPESQR